MPILTTFFMVFSEVLSLFKSETGGVETGVPICSRSTLGVNERNGELELSRISFTVLGINRNCA